ncbi:UNVERIFIED_CONTAM: Type I inositol polyphosphate 5-phosphatase 4 [Sesamum calycinum]|uniref:Type I inositol polyphosphate 5-phosphatase 4 n=1 Tax=Sesamum calycinum TaxID=2727403 RepID=A0AAW2SAG3_9LAMI
MENDISMPQPRLDRRFSVCDRVIYGNRPSDYYDPNGRWDGSSDDENGPSYSPYAHYSPVSYNATLSLEERDRHPGQSRYCLVASKQMVGFFLTVWIKSDLRDAVRNLKVSCVGRGLMGYLGNKGSISISMSLHQTSFCFICSHLTSGEKDGDELRRNSDVMEILRKTRFPRVHGMGDENSPQTILEHECDRILWYGRGLQQLSYVRGESRFSDHRPVYSIFLAEVESINRSRIKKSMSYSSSRVEVEELLPYSQGYNQPNFY